MATIEIENGKQVEELLQIRRITENSYFLVSDQGLARKIQLTDLRASFNGDTAISNLQNVYYSVEKINELLGHIYDELDRINSRIDNFDSKLDNIYNDFCNDLNAFKRYVENVFAELRQEDKDIRALIAREVNRLDLKIDTLEQTLNDRIDREVLAINNRIDKEVQDLNTRITNEVTTINNKIAKEVQDLNTRITNEVSTLNNTITTNVNNLTTKISNVDKKFGPVTLIQVGTTPPSRLTKGTLYLQYF